MSHKNAKTHENRNLYTLALVHFCMGVKAGR
jgi:hypothetical protein